MAQLTATSLRRKWYLLTFLITVFIIGYLAYIVDSWGQYNHWHDLIVPGVFFLGACFVWLAATLSLQTAVDIRRMAHLEQENITDPLLGIYNRRYLDRRIEEECARAKLYKQPLSVLLIDIDHFKRINDVYGHQFGDFILCQIGKTLLHVTRDSDVAARYGGDEILIITPNTTPLLAATLAERLRQHIESHALTLNNESERPLEIRVTASIGIAHLNLETDNSAQLLRHTDQALYQAKKEGRNRISMYGMDMPKVNPEMWE